MLIFDTMELSEQKLSLIARLMRVRNQETLALVEEMLIRAEMESRANESEEAIENGNVVSLEQFNKNNEAWLKKRASK